MKKLTVKQNLNFLNPIQKNILKELTHISKNLVNQSLYEMNQYYENTNQFLDKFDLITKLQNSENAKLLQSNMAQQIMKSVNHMFLSFFGTLISKQRGSITKEVRKPKYLDKDGFYPLIIEDIPKSIKTRGWFKLPMSRLYEKNHKDGIIRIKVPPHIRYADIREIRIVPKYDARVFEVHYAYNVGEILPIVDTPIKKAMAIDLGVNNFATCVTSEGKCFIIDGRKIKSYNQWYNKMIAELESIMSFHSSIP